MQMRVHPRPFGVVLRLSELMSAIPVAFALMPSACKARDHPVGGVSCSSAALYVSMFMSCGVLAPPPSPASGMATGLLKRLLISRWTASML